MTLRLYNTLTRTKEDFVPLDPNNVRMYVCGPTVYDFAHIGNARPVIVFDVLFRLLRHLYGEAHVTYVRNITDIDDKINARALERLGDRPILDVVRELTRETGRIFNEDVAALGALPPTHAPRATEYVGAMIAMIETLIEAGHAYEAQGHVLFDVSSKPDYGKLARRSLDEMMAGARVDVAPYKRGAMDFVLWKPSDAQTPGWESPWGRGRPGWHIECSAMSEAYLGESFDIHGGGIDLMFPHHENEIAQNEGAHHGHPLARVWMHNGFLNVEGEKMSKSLGNFVTIRELLNTTSFGGRSWSGEVLRLVMLKTHYRQPIDWTADALKSSLEELRSWSNAISTFPNIGWLIGQRGIGIQAEPTPAVIEALSDDLNTPEAVTVLRGLFNKAIKGDAVAAEKLTLSCEFLGLLNIRRLFAYNPYHVGTGPRLLPPHLKPEMEEIQTAYINANEDRLRSLLAKLGSEGVEVTLRDDGALQYEVLPQVVSIDVGEIQRLIDLRNVAKKRKDFAEADRIRNELDAQGIALKDSPTGTTWEVKR